MPYVVRTACIVLYVQPSRRLALYVQIWRLCNTTITMPESSRTLLVGLLFLDIEVPVNCSAGTHTCTYWYSIPYVQARFLAYGISTTLLNTVVYPSLQQDFVRGPNALVKKTCKEPHKPRTVEDAISMRSRVIRSFHVRPQNALLPHCSFFCTLGMAFIGIRMDSLQLTGVVVTRTRDLGLVGGRTLHACSVTANGWHWHPY